MRIEVAGGWIEVRERLKVKDERHVLDYISPYLKGPVEDFEATAAMIPANAVARTAVRLIAWHLPEVKPLPTPASFEQKVAAIGDLYPEVFKPIWDAVSEFETAQKAQEAEKNVPADGVPA